MDFYYQKSTFPIAPGFVKKNYTISCLRKKFRNKTKQKRVDQKKIISKKIFWFDPKVCFKNERFQFFGERKKENFDLKTLLY